MAKKKAENKPKKTNNVSREQHQARYNRGTLTWSKVRATLVAIVAVVSALLSYAASARSLRSERPATVVQQLVIQRSDRDSIPVCADGACTDLDVSQRIVVRSPSQRATTARINPATVHRQPE